MTMRDTGAVGMERVTVVGAGVIGSSWAAHFLAHGLEVTVVDTAAGAEQRLRQALLRLWPSVERIGCVAGAALERLRFTADLAQGVAGAQFVQENAPEHREDKQALIRDIDAATPSGAVIASSSSGLMPSDLQRLCARDPGRVLVGHPFHPPHLMPLVEVVGGSATDPGAIKRALAFYRAIGKRPIHIKKELPGHVANRLQAALWREAFSLLEQGAASVEDIDTAIMHGPGLRWALLGPFLTLHLTGGSGGMERILQQMGPSVERWWAEFTTPRLSPELARATCDGVQALISKMGGGDIEAERDALLIELLAVKATHAAGFSAGGDRAQ